MTDPMQDEGLVAAPPAAVCAGCNQPVEPPEKGTPLCTGCREQFVRYPIPRGIQLFGAAIILVMIAGFYSFPKNFSAGMHLEKGKLAAKQRRFRTAQLEFEKVVAQYPNHLEGQARLLMAAYYNMDLGTFGNTFQHIQNRSVDDQELYSQVEGVLLNAGDYYPSDSLNQLVQLYGSSFDSLPQAALVSYIARYPGEAYPVVALANREFDSGNYTAADTLLDHILNNRSGFVPAVNLKLAIKRQLGQIDSAFTYVDRLLRINSEHPYALSIRARLLLHQKKDQEALTAALQVHQLYKNDGHAAASLALAYHFNGQAKERDALMRQCRRDSLQASYFTYVQDILTGKETFTR